MILIQWYAKQTTDRKVLVFDAGRLPRAIRIENMTESQVASRDSGHTA